MSNRNGCESHPHRKPKVSLAMSISQGLGGPKVNPKGVADGQPVNIPAHPLDKLEMTENSTLSVLLDLRWQFKVFQELSKFSPSGEEIQRSILPRKVSTILSNGFRTANRHR